jgi:hypothetical protein
MVPVLPAKKSKIILKFKKNYFAIKIARNN